MKKKRKNFTNAFIIGSLEDSFKAQLVREWGLEEKEGKLIDLGITNCSESDFSVRFDGAAVLGTFWKL